MNILLLGYGKMGQMIDQLANQQGHTIVGKIDNSEELKAYDASQADVAIDFSQPDAAVGNIKWCIDHQIPVAVGTTGWLEQKAELDAYCADHDGTYLYASNFSIGVNLFFKLNEYLAKLMSTQDSYAVSTKEIHHTAKKDSPSGTSITLAEGILKHLKEKKNWVNQASENPE